MKLWVLLFLVFIIQDPTTTGITLLSAYQQHYNPWGIHLLFSIATILDIIVGYYVGKFIHKKYPDAKLLIWLRAKLQNFLSYVGKYGKVIGLLIFAPLLFPFSALFIPWLNIGLGEAIVYLFIGEWLFWYSYEWLFVLATKSFVHNSKLALYVIALIMLGISIITKMLLKRRIKGKNTSLPS